MFAEDSQVKTTKAESESATWQFSHKMTFKCGLFVKRLET